VHSYPAYSHRRNAHERAAVRKNRILRRFGPRYIRARRGKRLTAVWSLRPRHLTREVPA
jgi:hypothetical protein